MIIDQISNIFAYAACFKNLQAGLDAIHAMEGWALGRHDFEGGYFLVQEGDTTPMEEGKFEYHRKFVDVQIIYEGCEELGWAPLSKLQEAVPYDEAKDAGFGLAAFDHTMAITGGMFYAAFPWDGHRPSAHTGSKPHHYRKIVLKLPFAG